jgi:hypothetical protein
MWKTTAIIAFVLLLLVSSVPAQDETKPPAKPTDLKAKTKYDGAVAVAVLEWRDGSDNELGFEVLRSDNNKDYRVVGMVGANTTRYEDKVGRYITGAFTYKVRAFNQAGKSEDSNIVSAWF